MKDFECGRWRTTVRRHTDKQAEASVMVIGSSACITVTGKPDEVTDELLDLHNTLQQSADWLLGSTDTKAQGGAE